jgi:hypothetical protein
VKNVLAVALVVSLTSIALSQNPVPTNEERAKMLADEQAARAERRTKHFQAVEYKVLELGKDDAATIEKSLNAAAKEGYELERVVGDRIGIMRRQFKLPQVDRGPVQSGPSS